MSCRILLPTVALCLITVFPAASSAQSFERIYLAQMKLQRLGYLDDKPDGVMGPKTRSAIKAAGDEIGFEATPDGLVNFYTRQVAQAREAIENEEVVDGVIESVKDGLLDPFSAQFRDLHKLPSGAICGQVNAKNRYGAYVGWHTFAVSGVMRVGDQLIVYPALVDDETRTISDFCAIDIFH